MADSVRKRRKTRQNGVQAIFTQDRDRRWKVSLILGLLVLGAGAALLTWPIQSSTGVASGLGQLGSGSSPFILVLVALPLVTGGAGLCTYVLVVRRTRQEYSRIESVIYRLESLVGPKDGNPEPALAGPGQGPNDRRTSRFRLSKSWAIALVEAALLVILYGGLVAEYRSNVYFQEWVRANLPFGPLFFDGASVLFLAEVATGVFLAQWILRKPSSKASMPN